MKLSIKVLLLRARLRRCGLDDDEIENIPLRAYLEVAKGREMFVLKRGPGICPHCNRLRGLVISVPSTKLPLEKLFQ